MITLKNVRFFRLWSLTLFLMALVLLPGCGNKSGFYDVSGTVQLNGEDVPAGRIIFSPDRGNGNSGSQGLVEISQGRLTEVIRPIVGGPHWLEIQTYDGVAYEGVEETVVLGKRLIPSQKIQVDLPRTDVELAIVMQGQAKKGYTVDVKAQEE